mgnify:FL=1
MKPLYDEQGCNFLQYLIRKTAPIVVLGFVYYIWLRMTHLYIPCIFKSITGYRCPCCGTTTMCVSILGFRFIDAFYANPFIFTTIPFILFEIVYNVYLSYTERRMPLWNKILLGVYCSALLIFAIIRDFM